MHRNGKVKLEEGDNDGKNSNVDAESEGQMVEYA